MATITFTASAILPNETTPTTASFSSFVTIAGETLTAGMFVYKKASDGLYWLADNSTAAKSTVVGMVANGASAGQRFNLIIRDTALPCGAVLGVGNFYGLSSTPGKMCDIADVDDVPNIYKKFMGQSQTTSLLAFDFSTPAAGKIDVA